MATRKLRMPERLTRSIALSRDGIDEESRTVRLAFASEVPVERWYGIEVLDVQPESVRLGRLRDGGPLLMDHDPTDQVGVVEAVEIGSDRVARATVRFGNSARAQEVFRDIVDGIRRHVSVGYRIHKMVMESQEDGVETYRAVDWEPYEISVVSVPADHTVGVGRDADGQCYECEVEDRTMSKDQTTQVRADAPEPTVDVRAVENEVRERELKRIRDLESIGERFAAYGGRELAREAIREGWTVEKLREQLLERLPERDQISSGEAPAGQLDLSEKERRRYSLLRALNAALNGDWRQAEFERECSAAIAERVGRDPRGFYVPIDIVGRPGQTEGERVMNVTTGADLIATDHLADQFIESLRPASVVIRLGATVLNGLQGNVDIPRQVSSAGFQWLADDQSVTDSDLGLGSVALTPKTVAGSVAMSRRLLKQSAPSIEDIVRRDLVRGAALAIDKAALQGGGTNEPVGIIATTGVNTQTVTKDASLNLTPTWAEIVGFETALGADEALTGRLAYVTSASVVGTLKTTPKDTGSGLFVLEDGQMNGYPVAVSNQIPNRLIFGNFEDVLIGMWGVLDVMPDPAAKAASGGLVLRVFQDADVAVRHPQSFCIDA